MSAKDQTVEVHYTAGLPVRCTQTGVEPRRASQTEVEEAIDFGVTEVFVDSEGNHYGDGFGEILKSHSDLLDQKGKRRNKLHSLRKKALESGDTQKAKNIKRYNLGHQKQFESKRRMQATLQNIVDHAFNTFFDRVQPSVFITENLRHQFIFDNNRKFNRVVSIWIKGILQDRAEFKALEGCSLHKQVNPAYGSQTCPDCEFVWSRNRSGDMFQCQFCGHGGHSDRIAAVNYLARRSKDPEISLYVPYRRVRGILVERFLRRLECWDYGFSPSQCNWEVISYLTEDWEALRDEAVKAYVRRTVPGRTLDTDVPHHPDGVGGILSACDEGRQVEIHRSIRERNSAFPSH